MVYQLIYISAISQNVSKEMLAEIATSSRDNNRQRGITGVMLVHNGSVLQILEGEQTEVEGLYAKIARDPRHTQLIVMSRRESDNREFKDWSMGFKFIDETSPESALFKLTESALNKLTSTEKSQEVRTFGQSFARVSGF